MPYKPKDELSNEYGISEHGASVLKQIFSSLEDGNYSPEDIESEWKQAAVEDSVAKESVAVTKAEKAIDKQEAGSAGRNPHLLPDERLEDIAKHYTVEELSALELTDPDITERIIEAVSWEERNERAQTKSVTSKLGAADEAKTNAEALHGAAVDNFRARYWSMSQQEREATAETFGINLADYEPPEHPYGGTAGAWEGGDDS